MELGGGKSKQSLLDDDETSDKKDLLFFTSKNDVTQFWNDQDFYPSNKIKLYKIQIGGM